MGLEICHHCASTYRKIGRNFIAPSRRNDIKLSMPFSVINTFGGTANATAGFGWSTRKHFHDTGNCKGYWWWRHQLETFSALLALCAGNSPVTGEFPAQRPVTRNFDVFFDLCPKKRLSKQSWGWWLKTPSDPLWRHSNENNPTTFQETQSKYHSISIGLYF